MVGTGRHEKPKAKTDKDDEFWSIADLAGLMAEQRANTRPGEVTERAVGAVALEASGAARTRVVRATASGRAQHLQRLYDTGGPNQLSGRNLYSDMLRLNSQITGPKYEDPAGGPPQPTLYQRLAANNVPRGEPLRLSEDSTISGWRVADSAYGGLFLTEDGRTLQYSRVIDGDQSNRLHKVASYDVNDQLPPTFISGKPALTGWVDRLHDSMLGLAIQAESISIAQGAREGDHALSFGHNRAPLAIAPDVPTSGHDTIVRDVVPLNTAEGPIPMIQARTVHMPGPEPPAMAGTVVRMPMTR